MRRILWRGCTPSAPAGILEPCAGVDERSRCSSGALGLAQQDLKRLLAYSTVSQIGMMLGLGCDLWPSRPPFYCLNQDSGRLFMRADLYVMPAARDRTSWRLKSPYHEPWSCG